MAKIIRGKKVKKNIIFLGLLCFSICFATSALAISDNLKYNDINAKLTAIANLLKKDSVSSQVLEDDISYLREKRIQLENIKVDIDNDIRFVEKRAEALGDVPEDGNEIKLISEKRKEIKKELAKEQARLSEANLLLAKIDELELSIFSLRNKELWGNLLISELPLIYPSVLLDSGEMFFKMVIDVVKSPLPWYQNIISDKSDNIKNKIIPLSLVVIFITFIGWLLRRFILNKYGYIPEIEYPRFGRKISAAIFVCVAYGVIPTLIIGLFLFWIINGKILTGGLFGAVLINFLYYSLFVIMGKALCRVVFTPYNERWRLINVSTDKAKRVTKALYISVFLIGVLAFLSKIVEIQNYPIELMSFLIGISATIKAFCLLWVVYLLLWDNPFTVSLEEDNSDTDDEDNDNDTPISEDNWSLRLLLTTILVAITIFALSFFGYPYLALFIIDRIIYSIVLVLVFMGCRKVLHDILHRLLFLKFWLKTFRMRRRVLRRIDFWSSFIVDPLFVFAGLFVLLALWGVPTDVLHNIIYKLFNGFTIGGIKISLSSIILGIVVFFVSITIVKTLRQKLESGLLTRMDIEDGTRHSLAAGFSSIGYVASALLAIVIMGGNLTSLALVAGALSVGIGLGLQNVVNNFVSGIIILFERPVKVGDWVIINGEEGQIKQINIRSTEMETFNRSSLIIPNADLLSTTVTNLTHGNNWSRQKVKVGVAYGSDVEKVRNILLECAANNKKVMRKPEPYVLFQDFGSNSLDFELRCYTSDIWSGWTIPSDLRYEINQRFREEGIEIPFNQMVIHTGCTVSDKTENMFYGASNKEEEK